MDSTGTRHPDFYEDFDKILYQSRSKKRLFLCSVLFYF